MYVATRRGLGRRRSLGTTVRVPRLINPRRDCPAIVTPDGRKVYAQCGAQPVIPPGLVTPACRTPVTMCPDGRTFDACKPITRDVACTQSIPGSCTQPNYPCGGMATQAQQLLNSTAVEISSYWDSLIAKAKQMPAWGWLAVGVSAVWFLSGEEKDPAVAFNEDIARAARRFR